MFELLALVVGGVLFLGFTYFLYEMIPKAMINISLFKRLVPDRDRREGYIVVLIIFGPIVAIAGLVLFMNVMGWKFY